PGVRRLIKPQDLPAPYRTRSSSNGPGVGDRPEGVKPLLPPGFSIELVASGIDNPRVVRVAPNGDLFVADSKANQIRVYRLAEGGARPAQQAIFAEGLTWPYGIAFYPSGDRPQWVYVANSNSVVRFAYREGDLKAQGKPETIVPDIPSSHHWTRDIIFSPDGKTLYLSVGSGSNVAEDIGAEPEGAGIEAQGLGWSSKYATGIAGDAITSGLEVTWTTTPTKWSNNFFDNLFNYEWELTKSPAGAHQWTPKAGAGAGLVPDAHNPSKRHAPAMLTTDLSLRFDPAYEKISRRFHQHPAEFADAFARAWFKLTHRDMGPVVRYLGPLVPKEELIWQDPIPAIDHELASEGDIAALKAKILASGLSVSDLVSTAWASA
ncbi:MAG: hypothetical protein E5V33_19960, partial [Mesorhizobium sp.]